jgi:hypothetical protein
MVGKCPTHHLCASDCVYAAEAKVCRWRHQMFPPVTSECTCSLLTHGITPMPKALGSKPTASLHCNGRPSGMSSRRSYLSKWNVKQKASLCFRGRHVRRRIKECFSNGDSRSRGVPQENSITVWLMRSIFLSLKSENQKKNFCMCA